MRIVEVAEREQRVDPLGPGFPDADQDARREWNGLLAGPPDGVEARGGLLVGRAVVGRSLGQQLLRDAFQHDALRDRAAPQHGQILVRHQAWIDMGQKSRFAEHQFGRRRQVGQGRGVAQPVEFRPNRAVAKLRLIPQREQRLLAPRRLPGARDRQDFVQRQVGIGAAARRMGEGAVMANVPAQLRERDENLARIGDEASVGVVAAASGRVQQGRHVGHVDERECFGCREAAIVGKAGDQGCGTHVSSDLPSGLERDGSGGPSRRGHGEGCGCGWARHAPAGSADRAGCRRRARSRRAA